MPSEASHPPCSIPKTHRRTIAVLIDQLDHFTGGFEGAVRTSLQRAFEKLDLNLLVVAGQAFDSPDPTGAARNGIYDLIHESSVDGVIVVSAPLAVFSGIKGVRAMCERYRPLPLCSIGLVVPGVPSVVFDDDLAMRELVEHVVRVHQCRRIAFIGGPDKNPDAMHRYSITEDVLARHGITLERTHVARAAFTVESGAEAMRAMLERGLEFDAVIAANDCMALGALEVLQSRGFRVPGDVVVTGFDDLPLARFANPTLSTVRQPLEHMAALAARLVVDQIEGGAVPSCTVLPAEVVIRASCGCELMAAEAAGPPSARFTADAFLIEHHERLEMRLSTALWAHPPGSAHRLLAALRAELGGSRGSFREALELSFLELGSRYELYDDLDLALGRLWAELRAGAPELSDLFHTSRHLVRMACGRAQARGSLEMEATYRRFLKSGERFSGAFDRGALLRVLAEELPRVPTENAYVSLYDDAGDGALVPFFFLCEGEVREAPRERFDARRLLPPGAFPADRRHTSFALPLTSEGRRWGVVVIEVGSPFGVYQMLAEQLGASLNTLSLHDEIVRRTALHAKSVQERVATAERMQSLSTLAGGVAHDLNNSLGPLVALPDVMLAELDDIRKNPATDDAELRADIAAIKTTAVRASQTIKDLLTLGRKGRMQREVLDLNRVVERCLEGERVSGRRRGTTSVTAKLASEPLYVTASEPHVMRAVSNLVQNALDAIDGRGRIVVRLERAHFAETHAVYEAIEPGEYATISVEDDGPGITPSTLPRLFEPFFTTKRTGERTGTGLGLAIVHSVVKEHDGFVDVRSEPGTGTRFTLYFPLAQTTPASIRPRSGAPRGSARILVVDDEPLQLHSARRTLEHLGYQVSTITSGLAAYERFMDASGVERTGASPYDLVIFDMMLGEEQDGLEILRRVRELFPAQRGLLMSGHAPAERGELARQQGFAWLQKPFATESLASAVRNVLSLAV